MTARVGSAGAAFSSSSLSLPASVDTVSAAVHIRAPQLVSRSPSLLKASRGIAEAAAIRGVVPPCAFTLRGKRQRREHAVQHKGSLCSRAATTASTSSPRRPPYRVDIGQGYSPRLRMMGGEEFMHGSKATKVATEPMWPTSRSGAASSGTKDAASRQRASQPWQNVATASERDLLVNSAAETNETAANPARGSQGRTTKALGPPPCTRERPITTSRTDLCGRLWTGTTATPQPEAGRPRVLFLVSGQQQQLKDPPRTPCSEKRRQPHNVRGDPVVIPLPLPTKARISKTAVPRGRQETTAPSGWRWGRASRNDIRAGREGEKKGREGASRDDELSHGARRGVDANEECYDAPTTAATDGKGDDSARRVLHVRVPHPPPTSLLVLRSAPPATS